MTTPHVGYVLKVYPRFSETFVVTEILAREALGDRLSVYALRPTTDSRFHPEISRVRAPVRWLPRPHLLESLWTCLGAGLDQEPVRQAFCEILPVLAGLPGEDVAQGVALAQQVRADGVTHLHAHFASLAGRTAWIASRLTGVPYTVTTHAKDIYHRDVDRTWLRRVCGDAERVIAISRFNRDFLERVLEGSGARVSLQYNALELDRFPFRARPAPGPDRPLRVLGVGRLVPKKGFGDLVDAAASLRRRGVEAQVTVAGEGELRTPLQERVREAGLEGAVTFLGARTQAEVRDLLGRADVLVAPCVEAEDGNIDGLPTVVLEAMACGTPVVATSVSGLPEVVQDGVTGILLEPGDVDALADALDDLAAGRRDTAALARNGRALVEERFDCRRQARRLSRWEGGTGRTPRPGTGPARPGSGSPARPEAPTRSDAPTRPDAPTHSDTPTRPEASRTDPAGPAAPCHTAPRALRVAYLSVDPGVPVFGTKGASVHVQEVVRELRGRGHEVSVYTTRAGSRVPADLEDLRVVEVPLGPHPGTAAREAAQARAARELAARAEADRPDLVYERYSLFSRALSQVTATTGAASVLEVNSPLVDEQRTHRGLCDAEGALEALRAQVGAAGLTLCVSGPVEAWVRGHFPTGRVRTLPNGVNTVRITPRPEDPDQVVVTFVGTLKPWHGVEDLLRAATLAREPWSLRVVGDGPQGPALRSQAREDGLEVDFRGAVAPEQVPDHLAGSAVAVAPYPEPTTGQGHYFSPLKVYEYMAAGLPVVASAVGQLPGALEGCGLLVPPSDPQALADALDALASDPRRRRELGRRARQEAVEHHSWSRVVTRALELAGVDSA